MQQLLSNVITSTEFSLKLPNLSLYLEHGSIAWLFFHLEGRPVNVVNSTVLNEAEKILDELDKLESDDRLKLILFCSGKPDTFIAGADIDELYPNIDLQKAIHASKSAQRLFNRIANLKAITIACINGPALGAGLELALACDYRVCSDHGRVQLGLPEVKLGLLPGAGGTVRLPRLIGLQQALGLILSGGAIRPDRALDLHLIDAIIASGPSSFRQQGFLLGSKKFAFDLLHQPGADKRRPAASSAGLQAAFLNEWWMGRWIVARKAAESLDKRTHGRYPAPYLALESATSSLSLDLQKALDYEAELFGRLAISPESKALMAVFYLMESAKKIPKSLQLKGQPLPKLTTIGIIGAGIMGSQIAAMALSKGYRVLVRDITDDAIQAGMRFIRALFDDRVKTNRISASVRESTLKRLTFSTSLDGFRDCDVVIEAAVENLAIKRSILQEIEPILPPSAIFATNTSSLSITTLSSASTRPGQVCGMHFFNPVQKMPLVEVIKGDATEDLTLALIYRLALSLGKIPCLCRDAPGFIVNRILAVYMNEAGLLAMEGNPIPLIDHALTEFGMPMGPFRLIDEVGLDVASHVGAVLGRGLGARFRQDPRFASVLGRDPKRSGRKTGAGFYLYEKGVDGIKLNPEMSAEITSLLTGRQSKPSSTSTIIDRCILLSLQEACEILSKQICESAHTLDLAMLFGTGFAPFRGGLLNYADQRGIAAIVSRLKQLAAEHGERFDPHPLLQKMASSSTRFLPNRPHGMTPITNLPRSSLTPSKL